MDPEQESLVGHRQSARDAQYLTGDKFGVVTGKKGNRRGDVLRFSHSAERNVVAGERENLEAVLDDLLAADRDRQERHAKRFADYLFEVYVAALLLAEAQTHITERDDARKALVAQRFVDRHLRALEDRGIVDDDLPLEAFDAIVRYDTVDPELLPR